MNKWKVAAIIMAVALIGIGLTFGLGGLLNNTYNSGLNTAFGAIATTIQSQGSAMFTVGDMNIVCQKVTT